MPDPAPALTNEPARERNREAADRTLLAWVRASLAMISLGFGIERLGQAAVGFDGPLVGFSPFKTSLPLTNLRLEGRRLLPTVGNRPNIAHLQETIDRLQASRYRAGDTLDG